MIYKVGIENRFGNLLDVNIFFSDEEMYDFLEKTNKEFVQTNDLVDAKIIVQVYHQGVELDFKKNCICQYCMNFEENF